jgi:hypothetical protein
MSAAPTPRHVKAAGARDAHGRILDAEGGALFVHLHRESGLAHRHYVLKPWQVRVLGVLTAPITLVLIAVAVVTWGWTAGQAARVPLLTQEIGRLRAEAERIDTLSATLAELQARYDQVQRMLSAATAQQALAVARDSAVSLPPRTPPGIGGR